MSVPASASDPTSGRPTIAVIGAGIAGLAAAWQLHEDLPGARVLLLDGSDRPGGKLRSESVAGVRLDVGAESMLARRPEGLALVQDCGLTSSLVHPATSAAAVWSRGRMHPLPTGTLMGVPAVPASALGILTEEEVRRAERDAQEEVVPLEEDVAVGAYLAGRLGPAVVDRLVEPLLGGVYAGQAGSLSLQATVPALWQAAVAGLSPTEAAIRARDAAAERSRDAGARAWGAASGPAHAGPVFAGLTGGMATLAEHLAARLGAAGVELHSRTLVRVLERTTNGWRLVCGPVPDPTAFDVDAVVLAVPATPAARLLSGLAPAAAAHLARVEYASTAIVTLAYPRADDVRLPGSGFLVPAVEALQIKASTFSSAKWGWLGDRSPDLHLLRVSLGRHREEAVLQRSDEELAALGAADLASVLGPSYLAPSDSHVQRWGGALPQYGVGHVDRIADVRSAVEDLAGLELAGAAYEGVGIPACIATGREAARAVATHLRLRLEAGRE